MSNMRIIHLEQTMRTFKSGFKIWVRFAWLVQLNHNSKRSLLCKDFHSQLISVLNKSHSSQWLHVRKLNYLSKNYEKINKSILNIYWHLRYR